MSAVLVYGATGAGVTAAVAAAEAGARVVLAEPGRHVGGMVSGGLSWTDVGDVNVIRGLALRFYQAVASHYDAPLWAVKGPEPHVAEGLLTAMLDRAGVDVRLGEAEAGAVSQATLKGQTLQDRLMRGQTLQDRQATLKGPTLQDRLKGVAEAAVYVDASYEGDLMAALGVPYAVGREARKLYGETWAGRQPAYRPGRHNFSIVLSPFADDGSLLPHVRAPELDDRGWPAECLGEGDGGLQAYGFRVCLTDRPENAAPFEPPDGYDERELELAARYLDATGDRAPLGLVRDLLPNGKCDVNSVGPFSLNVLDGSNREYLDGDRAAVRAHHLRYTQAFLFFLAERGLLDGWGLAADEFADTGGWPMRAACWASTSSRSTTSSTHARSRTPSRTARTTSTSARSSARGATCRSTRVRRRSSTRATSRSQCRRIRFPTAR